MDKQQIKGLIDQRHFVFSLIDKMKLIYIHESNRPIYSVCIASLSTSQAVVERVGSVHINVRVRFNPNGELFNISC